jgi:hypothetical protein
VLGIMSQICNVELRETRTAWAVFKYCGTKTATLGLSIKSLYKILV